MLKRFLWAAAAICLMHRAAGLRKCYSNITDEIMDEGTFSPAVANITDPALFSNRTMDPSMRCPEFNKCVDERCLHKDLHPFTWLDGVAGVVSFLGCSLSVVGGVGGGGLFVPVLMLLLNFEADAAVPLSKSMIFGSAIVSVMFVMRQRVNGKPAIDYGVCALLQPLCLAGTVVGVFLNVLLPSLVIVVALALVLAMTTYKTTQKALQVYGKEQALRRARRPSQGRRPSQPQNMPRTPSDDDLLNASGEEDANGQVVARGRHLLATSAVQFEGHGSDDDDVQLLALDEEDGPLGHGSTDSLSGSGDEQAEEEGAEGMVLCQRPDDDHLVIQDEEGRLMVNTESRPYRRYQRLLRKEKSIRWRFVGTLVLMWVVLFSCAYGKRFLGCTPWFWIISFGPLVFALFLTVLVGRQLRREYDLKARCGHQFRKTDFIFNRTHTICFPLWSLLAGVAAGMVGIGGGMVLGPLLLVMSEESDPAVTSAISAFLVLFTSSATTAQFVLLHTLKTDYALYLAGVCALAGVVGQLVLKPMIDRSGRKSLILFALAIVIALSGVLTVAQGVRNLLNGVGATRMDVSELCRLNH